MSDNMTGEQRLRAAFERLKNNAPTIVPKGSKINPKKCSQNQRKIAWILR